MLDFNKQLRQALQLPPHPGGRQRGGQQRPRRHHARGATSRSQSREQPTNDPKCKRYEERTERGAGAASYRYQVKCPNDQNLIAIMGRALTKKKVPFPPLEDRTGSRIRARASAATSRSRARAWAPTTW